jgi:hypothetical protein
MLAAAPTVRQDGGVGAAGFFQSVGQHREPGTRGSTRRFAVMRQSDLEKCRSLDY